MDDVSDSFRRDVGKRLASARKRAGLSQAELAKATQSSQPAIARIESGRVKKLNSEQLERFLPALKIPLDELWPSAQDAPSAVSRSIAALKERLPQEDAGGFADFLARNGNNITKRELEMLEGFRYSKKQGAKLNAHDWKMILAAIRYAIELHDDDLDSE